MIWQRSSASTKMCVAGCIHQTDRRGRTRGTASASQYRAVPFDCVKPETDIWLSSVKHINKQHHRKWELTKNKTTKILNLIVLAFFWRMLLYISFHFCLKLSGWHGVPWHGIRQRVIPISFINFSPAKQPQRSPINTQTKTLTAGWCTSLFLKETEL